MLGQLLAREAPGGDGNGARADRFAARDIVRRVADDVDLRGREIDRVPLPRPPLREGPELVAIVVIVGKSAEFKKIPEPVIREFDLRAAFQVAGEKSEDIVRPLAQPEEQIVYSWKDPPFPLRQLVHEEFKIKIEKSRGRFIRHRDLLLPQNLVHDAGIGFARDFHSAQVVRDSKLLLQDILERLNPGAAGIDQGAVDVEKEKP